MDDDAQVKSELRCLVLNAGGSYHPDTLRATRWARKTATGPARP